MIIDKGTSKNDNNPSDTLKTSLVIFKHTNRGAEPFGDLECFDDNRTALIKLGSYYMVSIGQGDRYHQGLFGPLPVLDYNLSCIVYALTVQDENQEDIRLSGKNYILTCFFYSLELCNEVNRNRNKIAQRIELFFSKNSCMSDIENNWPALKKYLNHTIIASCS